MVYLKKHKKQKPRFIGWIALALAGVGTYKAIESSNEAADIATEQAAQQRFALEAQQRAASVQAQQEKIKQIREARIARARIIAQSSAAGMGVGTSGVSGAVGSIGTQAGANIGTISQMQSFSDIASAANIRSATLAGEGAQAQATAAQWQSLSNIGFTTFGQLGGWTKLNEPVKSAIRSPKMSTSEFMSPTQIKFG